MYTLDLKFVTVSGCVNPCIPCVCLESFSIDGFLTYFSFVDFKILKNFRTTLRRTVKSFWTSGVVFFEKMSGDDLRRLFPTSPIPQTSLYQGIIVSIRPSLTEDDLLSVVFEKWKDIGKSILCFKIQEPPQSRLEGRWSWICFYVT